MPQAWLAATWQIYRLGRPAAAQWLGFLLNLAPWLLYCFASDKAWPALLGAVAVAAVLLGLPAAALVRHCLCLVFPLPSRLRPRLSLRSSGPRLGGGLARGGAGRAAGAGVAVGGCAGAGGGARASRP